ncbi:hypothetical protein MtrunA17_Chr8g0352931 [Medicago truncatula]|uniref:Uncharacterized protein n=1 Tax=Medicago truncatula TaxID=3880 RepID=A4Q380_MEDTR|nr:hypothetical protein MtrDRAFT_AC153125g43v2 [Medicago truncatula]AET02300.1 hypothetical protein MTR_8g038740 [Medicago truncatula]RHN40270.1 hypothetical protein MtrunA17_Chr8g0352931 [Medicago truncatula]
MVERKKSFSLPLFFSSVRTRTSLTLHDQNFFTLHPWKKGCMQRFLKTIGSFSFLEASIKGIKG